MQTGRSAPRQIDVGGPGGAKIPAVYGSGKSAPFHFNTRPPALLMNLGLLLACAKAAERFEQQEPPLQTARWDVLAGPDLLRLTNICGGTDALANIGARRQQRLAVSATGGASALLLGKSGRRPQEKLLPGQFPPEGGCRAAAGGIH